MSYLAIASKLLPDWWPFPGRPPRMPCPFGDTPVFGVGSRFPVRKYEYSGPFVRGAHITSSDSSGTGGISEQPKVSEHETKSPGAVPDNVLSYHPAWP